jgi:hypothetical protein
MKTETFPTEVTEYLRLHHIITLSTASFTGLPHADTVTYASDETSLYFGAPPGTTIVHNIRDNRYVSFTIDDYTTDWRKVRELQGVGVCMPADEVRRAQALRLFATKFSRLRVDSLGTLFHARPIEVHFVDYEYETMNVPAPAGPPAMRSKVYQLEGAADRPAHGAVSTSLDRRSFASGEVIFRPGDPAGQYYVIVEGEVEVRGEGYGADQTVIRLGPGQLFGDQAALRGQRGATTAHAVQNTVLLAVGRDTVRGLLLQNPAQG